METDVTILGSGPAGVTLAAACAATGLRVEVWSPSLDERWAPTWGAWVDRVPEPIREAFAATWGRVLVSTGEDQTWIDRAYARFDSERLRVICHDEASSAGVAFRRAAARTARHHPTGSVVVDDAGREHPTTLVVDATGHGSLLRRGRAPTLFQSAAGVLAEVDGWDGAARWMDFGSGPVGDGDLATFLYAFPMPDGRVFLEETALVRRSAVPQRLLSKRLLERLGGMGVGLRRIDATEHCLLPMDRGVPDRTQRVVGFGAAAAMVHPATGFLLGRMWDAAPRVAREIASGLAHGPAVAARRAWRAIWPATRLRTRALHRRGAAVVAELGAEDTRRFFEAFFALPAPVRDAWIDDDLPAERLALGMVSLFGQLPADVRWRVVGALNPFRGAEAA